MRDNDRRQQTADHRSSATKSDGVSWANSGNASSLNSPSSCRKTPVRRPPSAVSSVLSIAHLFQAPGTDFREPGAAQLHIYHTMRSLQEGGHHVALMALEGNRVLFTDELELFQKAPAADSHYTALGPSGMKAFTFMEGGVRRVQQKLALPYWALFDSFRMYDASVRNLKGYDLIHERFNLLSLGGAWASRKLNLPLFLEVNADLLEQRRLKGVAERGIRRLFALWATRTCFNAAQTIICISADLAEHLQRRWAVEAERLAVLPCAADIDAFYIPEQAEQARDELGLADESVVMWVGGFYRWHSLDLLVESFARVRRSFSGVKLVLVGDGKTRAQIEQHVRSKGLEQDVIFTGLVPHARVPRLLAAADVVVAPAPAINAARGGTGSPLKLFEYMAAAKPIVATAVKQTTDVIKHGKTGLLVEPENAAAFAGAIESLLANADVRAQLAENARSAAVKRYSWKTYAQQLEEIYKAALCGPAPRGSRRATR